MNVLWIAPLLYALTWWVGARFLSPFRLARSERLWLAPFLGYTLLVLDAALLCFTGLLTPFAICASLFLLVGVSVCFPLFWKGRAADNEVWDPGDAGDVGFHASASGTVPGPLPLLVSLLCFGIGLHTFLCALTPEVRSDPIRYHISLANQYAVRGGIEPLRETVWWSIPQYAECLYALGIALCNDTLAKLFHWWAGVISTLGVFAIADRWFGRSAAWWAVTLWITTPMVSYEAGTTYVELILVLWVQFAIWSGSKALAESDWRGSLGWLTLSGLAVGMSFGTKFTALAVQGVPWLIFPLALALRHRGTPLRSLLLSGVPCLAVLVADSPWLLRNYRLTGNPLYPLYNSLFGLSGENDRAAELYFLTVWPGQNVFRLGYYLEKIQGFIHAGYNFLAIGLVTFLVPVAIRGKPDGARLFEPRFSLPALFCGLSLGAYLALTGNMDGRFWLPTLAVFLPFLGKCVDLIPLLLSETRIGSIPLPPERTARFLVWVLVLGCFLNYSGLRLRFFAVFGESPRPILTEDARWTYYAERERADLDLRGLEEWIPKGATVYPTGFPHRVRAISPVSEHVVDKTGHSLRTNVDPVFDPFVSSGGDPEAILRAAREVGIDYLVVPKQILPLVEDFWAAARKVAGSVPGSKGRLLELPRQAETLHGPSSSSSTSR